MVEKRFTLKKNPHYYEFIEYIPSYSLSEKTRINRDYTIESNMRAKRMVLEYGLNNKWSHFITISFDDTKIPNNIELRHKKLLTYFNHYQQRVEKNFKFIIVPEYHTKSGLNNRVHYHGLIYTEDYTQFTYMYYDMEKQNRIYRHDPLYKRFGAVHCTEIKECNPWIAYYVSKYISKSGAIPLFGQKYFCSRSLKKSESKELQIEQAIEYTLYIQENGLVPVFSNEYVNKFKLTPYDFEEIEKGNIK